MFSIVSPNHLIENQSESTKLVTRARDGRPVIILPKEGPIKLPRRESRMPSEWTLEEFKANPALLIMYLNDSCPYVQHLRKKIVELASYYMEKGLGILVISSDYITPCPQDGPDYPFTCWYDEDQDLASALSVVCTPEFLLFKEENDHKSFELVYRGQFDDSRPHNDVPVTGRDLKLAVECVLNDLPVPSDQKPCFGCSIEGNRKAPEE